MSKMAIGEMAQAPDWDAIAEKVRCPLCEYDLRGLSEPRCPECGFAFRWEEILDRTRRRHDYLFEHHPEKSFRSFVKTVSNGLIPWKFWRSLHVTQRPDLRRLYKYRAIVMGMTWLPFVMALISVLVVLHWQGRGEWVGGYLYDILGRPFRGRPSWFSVVVRTMLETSVAKFMVMMTLLLLSLPAVTGFALAVFRTTMRQANVEHHHVQRCLTYSFDFVVWPVLLVVAMGISMVFVPPRTYRLEVFAMAWVLTLTLPVVWGMMAVRLAFACRLYLRLRHSLAVVVACQCIVFMVMVMLIMFVGEIVING